MAQFIPARNDWANAFKEIGGGLVSGYQDRADENAIQNAVAGLGENASARDILNAVTGAKTYSPAAKQNFLKNMMGVQEFEELQRQHKANEEINELKADLTKIKDEKKANQDLSDALTMIDASGLEHDEKEALRQKVKNGEASLNAVDKILNGKGAINARKEAEEAKSAQHVFDELSGLVNEVGRTGAITGNLGLGKTGKAYAKFTSLTGGLESALVEMVNRGTLSNVRFKYITETLLPKPHDTQEQIRGKLEGLAELLELDSSALTGKKQESKIDKNIASLPDASRFPKKTIKSPDGEKYYSDGTKWVKK